MKYPLYELSDLQFEDLVVLICEKILGTGTINFSTGKDGGRDAKFTGKAEKFPSSANPWNGKLIIQAKHTANVIAKCSDSDFKTILKKEVKEKLSKLITNKEIDYYIVFTNRKLSGIADAKLSNFIDSNISLENSIIGEERIQLWLKEYSDIPKILKLNSLLLPLQFYEQDLKDIIIKFHDMRNELKQISKNAIPDLKYTKLAEKNELNTLSKEYFEFIKEKSLLYFSQIDDFLSAVKNRTYKEYYENTVSDLQEIILIKRNEFDKFEEIIHLLYNYVLEKSPELNCKRSLIRTFLHYMYANCDIGVKE